MTLRWFILAPTLLAASVAAAQSITVPIFKLDPRLDQTAAALKQDLKLDIQTCQMPDNQIFTAQISLTVTKDGTPDKVAIHKGTGNPCLDDAALSAVKAATFDPPTHKGRPVAENIVRTVDFVHYDEAHVPPVRMSADTTPPRVTLAPELDARSCHMKSGAEATAQVKLTVNTGGQPDYPSIAKSSGDSCIDEAALKAARGYLFLPAMKSGVAIPVVMNIEMQFNQM